MLQELFVNCSDQIVFYVNSKLETIQNCDPRTTLLSFLRDNGFTGTKYGCGEGGCGACTVVIAEYDANKKMINYRSANSCLLPLSSLNRKQVITVEGIGNPEKPNPIQVIEPF
jgi:xanthine dehydrogenase/oxidase